MIQGGDERLQRTSAFGLTDRNATAADRRTAALRSSPRIAIRPGAASFARKADPAQGIRGDPPERFIPVLERRDQLGNGFHGTLVEIEEGIDRRLAHDEFLGISDSRPQGTNGVRSLRPHFPDVRAAAALMWTATLPLDPSIRTTTNSAGLPSGPTPLQCQQGAVAFKFTRPWILEHGHQGAPRLGPPVSPASRWPCRERRGRCPSTY